MFQIEFHTTVELLTPTPTTRSKQTVVIPVPGSLRFQEGAVSEERGEAFRGTLEKTVLNGFSFLFYGKTIVSTRPHSIGSYVSRQVNLLSLHKSEEDGEKDFRARDGNLE